MRLPVDIFAHAAADGFASAASAAVAADGDADAPGETAVVSVGGSQAASDSAKTAPIRTSAAVRPSPSDILGMMKPSVGDRFNGFRLSAISERAAAKSAARMEDCITKAIRRIERRFAPLVAIRILPVRLQLAGAAPSLFVLSEFSVMREAGDGRIGILKILILTGTRGRTKSAIGNQT